MMKFVGEGMHARAPDPEMRSPAAANGRANRIANLKKSPKISEAALDVQAQKLRRLYSLCHSTARTISALAFGVVR
jgi:hypothetical protein